MFTYICRNIYVQLVPRVQVTQIKVNIVRILKVNIFINSIATIISGVL